MRQKRISVNGNDGKNSLNNKEIRANMLRTNNNSLMRQSRRGNIRKDVVKACERATKRCLPKWILDCRIPGKNSEALR